MALSRISGTTGIVDGSITSAKLADFSAAVDLNGVELILDADADTSISADTDDQIDIKIANADHLKILSSSGDTVLKPMVDAKDIIFQQFDGNKVFEINDGNFVSVGGNATAAGQIRIYEDTDNGSHYSGFTVGNLTASVAYQLPNADGSSGQQLTTDGSGVLSWAVGGTNPPSADGDSLGTASLEWSDLFLADGGTIQFGNDQDVTLTHVADTGLLLSATDQLQFGDSGTYIHQSADGVLDLVSDTEIELNATTIDVNGNLDVSGTITSGGIVTGTGFTAGSAVLAEAELELLDGLTAGTAIASKVVTTDANIDSTGMRNLTISGELDAATLDISGNADIDGTTNLDVVDIDGAVDMASTLQVDGNLTTSGVNTFTVADNSDNLTLKSTDTDANGGPNLRLYRAVTGAAADTLGVIDFAGQDAGSNLTDYARIEVVIDDATDNSEDASLIFRILNGGALNQTFKMTGPETVINDASIDHDFRVESNGSTHALFVDGGNNRIGIGTDTPDFPLHIRSMGSPSNDTVLCLEGGATDANCRLTFQNSGGTTEAVISYDTDDDNLQFIMAGSEIARFRNARLGIGNTNPLKALDVTGDAKVSTDLTVGDDLFMLSDAAVIHFGADSEITLTHVHDAGLILGGTTPTLTMGDGGAEDTKIVFDGNQVDFVMGIDDSADEFRIGVGTGLGSTRVMEINTNGETVFQKAVNFAGSVPTVTVGDGGAEDALIRFDGNAQNFHIGLDDSTDKLTIGLGNTLGTYPAITIDENTNVVIPDSSLTVIGSGNYDIITLKSTDADSNVGPVLNFTRDSSSPANNDFLGELTFQGDNNAGDAHDYIRMFARILNVADGSEQADFIMKDATGNNIVNFAHSEVVYNDDSVDRDFRVESNGNANAIFVDAGNDRVGFFTNSPSVPMHLKKSNNDLMFLIHNEETSGNVFGQQINFSSTQNDTGGYFFRCVGNNQSTVRAVIFANGDFDSATNSYGATSDERIKQNITDANSQWDDIKALKVRNFKLKDEARTEADGGQAAKTYLGLVAQETETVSPGLVKSRNPEKADILSSSEFGTLYEDGDDIPEGKAIGDVKEVTEQVKSVSYSVLYMKAIKALQEAQTRIETLETKVQALEDA